MMFLAQILRSPIVLISMAFFWALGAYALQSRYVEVLKRDNVSLERSLASERAARAQAEEARRVHEAFLAGERKRREEAQSALDAIRNGEGANEPLSDYLRLNASRLWP